MSATKRYENLRARVLARPGAAERVDQYRQELLAQLTLAELREARALTQKQLAAALNTTQSGISRIEHETDLYLSTLRKYVEALGGELRLEVVFEDGAVSITTLADLDR
jgi:ribosome-binding protein aMBF1 (putative translation factor)